MHIVYQIIADGQDITAKLQDRLISLNIIDEAGQKSDSAEITIDDRDHLVELPRTGAELNISLGVGGLTGVGSYVVDEVSGEFAPSTITISAKAANMLGAIRARKTRAWRDVTIEDIIRTIAGEHGLKPKVSDGLKGVAYAYQAQTTESDLNFLTRLAKDLDAVAKPAAGHLLFVARGEGKTASGSDLPVFNIDRTEMASGSWNVTSRGRYGRVTAEWGERGTATAHKVTAGDLDPELALRHRYPTETEAQNAVDAALGRSARASGKISIELAGFRGDLMAEAKVNLSGIKTELTGEWLITRVQHRLSTTLTTSFAAERDNRGRK